MLRNWSHLKSNNRTTCYSFNFLLEEKVLINNLFSGVHLDILIKWHFSECKNIILLSTEAEMAKLGKVWSFLCHLKIFFKQISHKNKDFLDFPGCTVDKNPPANAGDGVWSLIGEDPTCLGTTKPVGHNYWTCACRACALQQEKPPEGDARAPEHRVAPIPATRESLLEQQGRPRQPKIKE